MNLSSLSDSHLLSEMERLNIEEQERLVVILHHLKEIETRRLFSTLHYSSLFEYTIKKLNYTEDKAQRRISAMRLLKELPEIEEKISSGALNLTNLGQAQTLFRAEKKYDTAFSKSKKLEVLKKMEGKTKTEAVKIAFSYSSEPQKIMKEKVRVVSENLHELKFPVEGATLKKMEKVKGLLAHSSPHISMAELLDKLLDLGIETWDPSNKRIRERKKPRASPAPARVTVRHKRKHIPNSIQREVWRKANSQCEICNSTYALEVDHIIPLVRQGSNERENLRLLCRICNSRAAIEKLGLQKVKQYLKEGS